MKKNSTPFWIGCVLVSLLVLVALITPWLPIASPGHQDLAHQFESPSWHHPFGLGENGVDVLSQVFWGARLSLGVGFGSVLISSLVGLVLGSCAGFFGGRTDRILSSLSDLFFAFPGLLLVVALAAVLGPSIRNMVIVLATTSWAGYARLVRGTALSLREREYVQAARATGASDLRVLVRHVWPNLSAPLLVQMTFGLASAILTESSLSFLGLGAPPGSSSWGQLLNSGREVISSSSHVVAFPGLMLALTVLGLNLLGDGLRDRFDPRSR